MRNIILAVILATPIAALASDPNARMEASGVCIECATRGIAGAASQPGQLQAVSSTVLTAINVKKPDSTSTNLQVGRIETHIPVKDEKGNVGIGMANGVILSPCLLLANTHGILGMESMPDFSADHTISFYFGESSGQFRWKIDGTPLEYSHRSAVGAHDFAVVELNKCAGKKVGWPELDTRTPEQLKGVRLVLKGIAPSTTDGRVTTVTGCVGQGVDPITRGLKYSCPTEPGLSGSGVFTEDGKLVAIHVGRQNGFAIGVSMSEVMANSAIRQLYREDLQAFASEQAALASASGPTAGSNL